MFSRSFLFKKKRSQNNEKISIFCISFVQFIKRWKISCNLVSDVAQGSLVFTFLPPTSDWCWLKVFPSQYLHVYWNTAPLVKTFNACISTTEDIFMCIILVNIEFCIWAGWFWPLLFFLAQLHFLRVSPWFEFTQTQ